MTREELTEFEKKLLEREERENYIAELEAEIERMLEERPQYRPMQEEIRRLMDGASSFQNKVAILTQMMNEKKKELLISTRSLQKELQSLKVAHIKKQIEDIKKGER